ncbi:hypothetical protein [Methylomonas sp. CM2]|uniref:hypothetical protein n=1 Tax=Methylomonas sp. CM2 TaxID=3417647 RepID=UPI003CEB016C
MAEYMTNHSQPTADPSEHIFPLPGRQLPPKAGIHPMAAISPGRRYPLNPNVANIAGGIDGLIGGYRLSLDRAEILPIVPNQGAAHGFVWDEGRLPVGVATELAASHGGGGLSRLTLHAATLEGLEVKLIQQLPVLNITPRFAVEWETRGHGAQLGVVQLVESARTAHFADGGTLNLLNTANANAGPVLYLDDPGAPSPVIPVCGFQNADETSRFEFSESVRQPIYAELDGQPVASISVLEQYTLYFLANTAPDRPDDFIWTPVHLPIIWGWSIRVQQRFDGVWDIFRRKLIMPTPSTEAPPLPTWTDNSLRCRTPLDV